MMRKQNHAGFTLVELVVVTAVIALLAGIILATLGPARTMARVAACTSNLRQIGQIYKMYLAYYDQYPAGEVSAIRSYSKDPRILFCPADASIPQMRAASSYIFAYFIPPDFTPLPEIRSLNPNKALVICEHHLGPKVVELKGNKNPRLTAPQYPYHLILRADGRVERIHLSRIRQLAMPGDRPSFMEVYPDEPGYDQGEPIGR